MIMRYCRASSQKWVRDSNFSAT